MVHTFKVQSTVATLDDRGPESKNGCGWNGGNNNCRPSHLAKVDNTVLVMIIGAKLEWDTLDCNQWSRSHIYGNH